MSSTSNQAIPKSVQTPVNFQSEVYDTAAIHDNVTNNSRFTIPAGWVKVRLTAGIVWQASESGDRIIQFFKNGVTFLGMTMHRKNAASSSADAISSPVVPVVVADYFEFAVWQNTSGNLNCLGPNIGTYFSIERVE